MNAIPDTDPRPPDFTLRVQRASQGLRHILSGSRLEHDIVGEISLPQEPGAYLSEVLDQLDERLGLTRESTYTQQETAVLRLESQGAVLGRAIIPESIRSSLLEIVPPTPTASSAAPSMLVISDQPTIPWELLRLVNGTDDGPFLGEAFALSRWYWGRPLVHTIPVTRPALMIAEQTGLKETTNEGASLEDLWAKHGLQVERVKPDLLPLLTGLASTQRDAWHLIGHGKTDGHNPWLWRIQLSADAYFQASDLSDPKWSLAESQPFVFLNACRSAAASFGLRGQTGLAQAFVEAGATAVVGGSWVVSDGPAAAFAEAFYARYLQGLPLAEAARQARLEIRDTPEFAGDPTWLAFAVFGHPRAQRSRELGPAPPLRHDEPVLERPREYWRRERYPPGALLQARFEIVPFHRRQAEIDDLWHWCEDSQRPISVRLFTGPGGMGKTRLSLEHCHRLFARGWRTGFIPDDIQPDDAVEQLFQPGGPLLAVIDYAEGRGELTTAILNRLAAKGDPGPYRLILLARLREEWWEQLRMAGGPAGGLLASAATQHKVLPPLANKPPARVETYDKAVEAFSSTLQQPVPTASLVDPDARYFEQVLMLHISALGAVQEQSPLSGEDDILDWVLDRERRFWKKHLRARELPVTLFHGVGRAMAAFTLAGGAETRSDATALIEELKVFRGQPQVVIENVADLLHETYPGRKWIMPVQPDILGEHLIERELVHDPQEIFNLVLGPTEPPEPADET